MRINHLRANNFKSLVHFDLGLPKFGCLIGLNGAGKSTILQFIDFIAQQMRGDIDGWLSERNWSAKELTSRLVPEKYIEFTISLDSESHEGDITWRAAFDPETRSCVTEHIETSGATLEVRDDKIRVIERGFDGSRSRMVLDETIALSYQGSIVSQIKKKWLPEPLRAVQNYFSSITSLDLLSPELLRQQPSQAGGSIGLGGQKLAAFLDEMEPLKRDQLASAVRRAYPRFVKLEPAVLPSGTKTLEIVERFDGREVRTESRHINDGMLRLIAILAELGTAARFLLFEEIENGVNPELTEFVVDELVSAEQQVLVTTHSPMVLNYLDDATATTSVIYVHKTLPGRTLALPFFTIPSLAEKLKYMGPGEAFADTDLTTLANEIDRQEAGA